MEGVFGRTAKPCEGSRIDLKELPGMRLSFAAMGTFSLFFLLRAFFSGIFEYTGKSGAGKGDSEIRKQNFLKMEEVDLREFRLGIEGEDGFLRFLFDRMRRFSTGIFMNQGFRARCENSFL